MKSLLTRIPGTATWAIVFLLAIPLASLANDHDKHKHHHGPAQNHWNNHGNNHWSDQSNNHWNRNHHQGYYGQNCPAPSVAGIILSLVSGFNSAPQVRYYAPPAPRVYYGCGSSSGNSAGAAVQLALARAGYYRGPIDGCLGPTSRQAIACYQADHGMRVTGYPSRSLLYSLGL